MKTAVRFSVAALMAIASTVFVNSQDLKIDGQTQKYSAGNIIKIDSMTVDMLHDKTLQWLYKEYPNTGKKGSYINARYDKITAHQCFNPDPYNLLGYVNLKVWFILTFDIKDGKIRYSYSDFYYHSMGEGKVPFESHKFENYNIALRNGIVEETNKYVKNSVVSLITYIQNIKEIDSWKETVSW